MSTPVVCDAEGIPVRNLTVHWVPDVTDRERERATKSTKAAHGQQVHGPLPLVGGDQPVADLDGRGVTKPMASSSPEHHETVGVVEIPVPYRSFKEVR